VKSIYVDAEHWATINLVEMNSHAYIITSWEINRKYRGKGFASKLFDEVCADADNHGTGLDSDVLEAFYERRGFMHMEESEIGMIRYPKRTHEPGQPAA